MRPQDIALTALAPIIWGSSYIVATEALPGWPPLLVALLRALPAGLLLLLVVRELPERAWWGRLLILGALNFSVFWAMLFIAAYRLPGGVAALLGAMQPLLVLAMTVMLMQAAISWVQVLAAIGGIGGVALLLLGPVETLDPLGIAAGLASAASMALGVVLTRKWRPDASLLAFTSWQLTAGGVLLIPVVLVVGAPLPPLSVVAIGGLAYLSLIGGAFTYLVWFRGISIIGPFAASTLGFLSPLTAILIGWVVLGQQLSPLQAAGAVMILGSILAGQVFGGRSATKPSIERGDGLRMSKAASAGTG